MNEQETAINDYIKTQGKNLKTVKSYLGRNVQDVLKGLGQASLVDQEKIAANALTRLKADLGLAAGETVYAGGASLWGFVRGGISANVYFGDAGSYSFSGSMWTSPIGVGGGGAGAWTMTASNGQEMDFTWAGGALEGGSVAIFWSISGTVVGGMAVVVAGVGVGGGHGSGVWTKG
jgi:hypothetical protein